jgi:hypothetical protein
MSKGSKEVAVMSEKSMGREGFLVSDSKSRGRDMMSVASAVAKRLSRRDLAATAILAAVLAASVLVISSPLAATWSALVVTGNEDSVQRGIDASAARYTALAGHFAMKNENIQRGLDASAARYTALAGNYAAKDAGIQRGIAADAARYTALAGYYAARADAIQRGIDADAARYSALGEYYATQVERKAGLESVSQ